MVVGFGSSGALAATMGPPVAVLKADQFSAGLDYSYSDMGVRLEADRARWLGALLLGTGEFSEKIDIKSNMILGNLGYGILDNWEVFLRLGIADTSVKDISNDGISANDGNIDFDGDYEFAWGFGTKATFYERANLKLGGLFQMNWAKYDGNWRDGDLDGTSELDWYEAKVAAGPTYKLRKRAWVYGGLFLHYVRGSFDLEAERTDIPRRLRISGDVEEESRFGAYIGALIEITENLPFYVEWQFTGDVSVFGAGLAGRF
jgi:hypothetical protein